MTNFINVLYAVKLIDNVLIKIDNRDKQCVSTLNKMEKSNNNSQEA